jgi:DNA-binding NarL/FixJ family response regulator
MSQPGVRPSIAIIDARELRRASISSLLEPWAKVERLLLKSFSPDHVREALHSETDVRLLIFSVGGDSIAEHANLQQLKVLRALASNVPLVIISDREDASEIAAAFTAEARGFINSGIPSALAYRALSFVMNGGSYFPPSAMRQLKTQPKQIEKPSCGPSDDSEANPKHNGHGGSAIGSASSRDDLGCQAVNLTARQQEVLEHLRLGESNKIIARRLGMREGTVKVHIRQMMRKCHASNRIQLALRNGSRAVENRSTVEKVWAQDLSTRPLVLLSKQ